MLKLWIPTKSEPTVVEHRTEAATTEDKAQADQDASKARVKLEEVSEQDLSKLGTLSFVKYCCNIFLLSHCF